MLMTQAAAHTPIRWLRSRLPLGPPPARGLSSDAKGSADNIAGADLLGLSCEKVNATDVWWPIRGSEGHQLTSPKGLGIIAMRDFPNV